MIGPQNKNGNFFMLSNSIFKQGLKTREFIVYI